MLRGALYYRREAPWVSITAFLLMSLQACVWSMAPLCCSGVLPSFAVFLNSGLTLETIFSQNSFQSPILGSHRSSARMRALSDLTERFRLTSSCFQSLLTLFHGIWAVIPSRGPGSSPNSITHGVSVKCRGRAGNAWETSSFPGLLASHSIPVNAVLRPVKF